MPFNLWDIIILIIIAIVLTLAFLQTRKNAKKGGCSCGCQNCSSSCNQRKSSLGE